jgi:transposase
MKWVGTLHARADQASRWARDDGASAFGQQIAGHYASFTDAWAFQASIAEAVGCCVRTVQRWIRRFKDRGALKVWPARPGEILPGRTKPFRCWASHRAWQFGVAAVERTKVGNLVKDVTKAKKPRAEQRKGTSAELAELQAQNPTLSTAELLEAALARYPIGYDFKPK